MAEHPRASWGFEAGDELAPGRSVVRLLGGGERAEAWLGWDEHLASVVVLKVLRPDHVDRERSRAALAREADILRSVAHPGIVRCFGADLDGPRPYLVLEHLEGPRLSTLVRRYGPLTAEQLVPLLVDLGSALRYLHHEGLVHLDVKPQNVIMGAPPRLIDLSLVRRLDAVTSLTAPLGSAAWMAPEQCETERLMDIGPWTDVWGLGATCYLAASGRRPFRERRGDEPHPQLTEDPAPLAVPLPEVLRRTISACLARDPAARPTLPAIRDALEPLLPEARDVALRRIRRRLRT